MVWHTTRAILVIGGVTRGSFSPLHIFFSVLLSHSVSPNIMSEVQDSSFLSTDSFFSFYFLGKTR